MTMKNLQLLGCKARDRVTGFEGVITTIGFDLVGCVQAVITPPASVEKQEQRWLDVSRLEIGERVMDHGFNEAGEPLVDKGPCEKPLR